MVYDSANLSLSGAVNMTQTEVARIVKDALDADQVLCDFFDATEQYAIAVTYRGHRMAFYVPSRYSLDEMPQWAVSVFRDWIESLDRLPAS
jgi:hypothetical protein